MKPTLLVLAAGMGSRYGGLKQLDALGPHGETIMDYSVYDAIRAGFGKVVFVIRHDFEKEFDERVLSRYRDSVPVEVVYQTIDDLPAGFTAPEGRTRPWGTNHAVMMGAEVINEPFAVINADDFYGREAFASLADYLTRHDGDQSHYCMVGFKVGNTMTANGSVSRGVCTVDARGRLRRVVECRKIWFDEDGGILGRNTDEQTPWRLNAATPVSMNLWGFTPDYFKYSKREFKLFLKKYIDEPGREFFIPSVVDKLIGGGEATVRVLHTDSRWFGVTYAGDRQHVCDNLAALHQQGEYPDSLFDAI